MPLPGCLLAGFVAVGDSFAGAAELEGGGGGFAVVAGWWGGHVCGGVGVVGMVAGKRLGGCGVGLVGRFL